MKKTMRDVAPRQHIDVTVYQDFRSLDMLNSSTFKKRSVKEGTEVTALSMPRFDSVIRVKLRVPTQEQGRNAQFYGGVKYAEGMV